MAITTRRAPGPELALAAIVAHNKLCASLVAAKFHADTTSLTAGYDQFVGTPTTSALQVSAPVAADLPTSIALYNNQVAIMSMHFADNVATGNYAAGAHQVKDSVNSALLGFPANGSAPYVTTGNAATDLTNMQTLATTLKATFNAHLTQAAPSAVHFNNDGTNTVVAAAATTLASLITLLNAITTALNAHITNAPTVPMVNVINA